MQIKIAITGPESSGKTTLAKALSEYYHCALVPEFARKYLNTLNRDYHYSDLVKIAKGQKKIESIAEKKNDKLIISDTTLQVIRIWSFEKFKNCDPWILSQPEKYTHYLLCKPDFPWHFDSLRENPVDRDRLFNLYLTDLKEKPFSIMSGDGSKRLLDAKKIISQYTKLKKNK